MVISQKLGQIQSFLQNSVVFCTLYPRGYTAGAFAPYKPRCCCQWFAALKELLMKKYLLIKKDLLISFIKVIMKMKMFKCQKTIIQAIKKVTRKFLIFFLVKILVMSGYLKNYETECFIQKQPTRDVLQK